MISNGRKVFFCKSISVKRCHGLGNVVLLLPVLDYFSKNGYDVNVATREEWAKVFAKLRPQFNFTATSPANTIDLDSLTVDAHPNKHRTDEFAELLGVSSDLSASQVTIPHQWSSSVRQYSGSIIFAPEAGHPSRRWPIDYCNSVKTMFPHKELVLVGTKKTPNMICDVDLRGELNLEEVFGLLSICDIVISMDSAVLHIAAAMRKHSIAIFGGVDYHYRLRKDQPVVVLQAKLNCCPCNKNESCKGDYICLKAITPEHLRQAVKTSHNYDTLFDFFDAAQLKRSVCAIKHHSSSCIHSEP